MHAFGQGGNGEGARHQPTQGGGDPELVIIAAAGIKTDDQARSADPILQGIDVVRQVEAATLFAGFDDDHAAGTGQPLQFQGLDCSERGKGSIAVVRPPAAVELAVPDHRLPRPEPFMPAFHGRLFVEVSVQQHCLG